MFGSVEIQAQEIVQKTKNESFHKKFLKKL